MNAKQSAINSSPRSKKGISTVPVANEQSPTFTCPRTTEEVYTMGVKLQYMIGDLYLNYADKDKVTKNILMGMAMKQLDKKAEVQELANIDLNKKLNFFYNNGGPILEPPVDEKKAKEINGFFNRIAENYLMKIDDLIHRTTEEDQGGFDVLETEVNKIIVRMLTDLANLYHEKEIRMAFKNLINL